MEYLCSAIKQGSNRHGKKKEIRIDQLLRNRVSRAEVGISTTRYELHITHKETCQLHSHR
jgi:hypothetical protein